MTAALPVDSAAAAAHDAALEAIAAPGAWWSGADRLAIVRAARSAPTCSLCARRASELSPGAVQGEHDNDGELPPIAVEAVHAIRNDSGRLTRRWFDDVVDMGMLPEAYVELVAVTASSVIVDTYAQGVGLDMPGLPRPADGAPTLERSDDVVDAGAWLPVAREGSANILRSLGLVPSARELFLRTFGPSYYMDPHMNPGSHFALDRAQVELVAARVSAVNECFY